MIAQPTGTEAAVCDDIARRQLHGLAKYGVTVAANPLPLRAWLQHAYEETLDQAVYLKRAIAELEDPRPTSIANILSLAVRCGITADAARLTRFVESLRADALAAQAPLQAAARARPRSRRRP